MPYHISFFNM
jgi:hypothetical protein